MTRIVFAALLAFLIGCGSKSNSTQPSGGDKPEAKVELTPIPVKPSHEMDPAKHTIPPAPVSGNLGKVEIAAAEARVEGKNLILQKPAAGPGENWRVTIELPAEPGREGSPSKMVLAPTDSPMGTTWTVNVDFPKPLSLKEADGKTWKSLGGLAWSGGCAVTLEWGNRENGKLPGKVYLCVPSITDAHPDTPTSSVLAGTFIADCARSATDPPGADEVPYVKGTVSVKTPAPNANLRVGYVGTLPMENLALGIVSADLDGGQQARANYDKPHVSTLIAGDGKMAPSHYEHSKLTPGRYFVFATLPSGPAVWKWVDVKAGDKLTLDLTIDATQTGGLEVTPPLEALGKVQISPTDDVGQPPTTDGAFQGRALQLGLEVEIVNRKALFKNLAPGRYEVRAAKQSRTVEVVAGKTVELDFEKK
jgi:hypothetical protein